MQQIKTLQLALTKHWRGPIDLENKYKPEQGTIWNWTDPTLPSTAPEKFLDIFHYYHLLTIFFIFKFFITPLIFIFKPITSQKRPYF